MMTTTPRLNPASNVPREDSTSLIPKKLARSRPLFDPAIVGRAIMRFLRETQPADSDKNPVMFVVEVGAALTTVFLVRDIFTGAAGYRLHIADRAVALVHGAVREFRRSHGGRRAARPRPTACARPRPMRRRDA